MNSSTRRAIASEKTIPAMTARAVITSCMTFLLETYLQDSLSSARSRRPLPVGLRLRSCQQRSLVASEDACHFFIAFPANFYCVADVHEHRKFDHVAVMHADETG